MKTETNKARRKREKRARQDELARERAKNFDFSVFGKSFARMWERRFG